MATLLTTGLIDGVLSLWLVNLLADWRSDRAITLPPRRPAACPGEGAATWLPGRPADWLQAPSRSAQTPKMKAAKFWQMEAGEKMIKGRKKSWERKGEREGLGEELPCLACCSTLGNLSFTLSFSLYMQPHIYTYLYLHTHRHTHKWKSISRCFPSSCICSLNSIWL